MYALYYTDVQNIIIVNNQFQSLQNNENRSLGVEQAYNPSGSTPIFKLQLSGSLFSSL